MAAIIAFMAIDALFQRAHAFASETIEVRSQMKDKPEAKMSGTFQESKAISIPVGVLGACPVGRDVEGQGCSLNMNHAGDHAIVRVK